MIADTKAQLSDFKLGKDEKWDFKNCQPKIQESLNLIAEWIQRFFYHIFAYYDSPLHIGSDEIIKRLQMWLNNPQCEHKEGQKFPLMVISLKNWDFFPFFYVHNADYSTTFKVF